MKRLLNTLFVTSEDAYLTLDGENIVVRRDKEEAGRFPLHNFEEIVCFSYAGASPALMGACTDRSIGLSFCSPSGRFLARTAGITNGNVLLRREQYRAADDPLDSCRIAKYMILGKLYNCRWSIERTKRDHRLRIDEDKFSGACLTIRGIMSQVPEADSTDSVRGLEGAAASVYFEVFDDMILRNKETFFFKSRNRRPPTDNVNAMLSFAYSLLARNCASALESVGLDAYVGFMHRDRPGRTSLALDIMEELRPCLADRFVLTLINNNVMQADDFENIICAANVANRILGFVNAPSLMQLAVAKCLDEQTDVAAYDRNRRMLFDALTEYGYEVVRPEGAFYLWVKTMEENDREFVARAKEYNLLVVPGSSFMCPGYVRIAYCVDPEMIKRSLPAFKKLAQSYRK